MHLSYLFNDDDDMKDSATKYFEVTTNPSRILMHHHSSHVFVGALVAYRMFRETGESIWAARAKKFHSMIRTWSKEGSDWNFEHKCDLLDAEEQYSYHFGGNHSDIQVAYANAIEKAIRHKFIHDAALASERVADFYSSIGNQPKAQEHYTQAHAFYNEWGARAKASSLVEFMKKNILFT